MQVAAENEQERLFLKAACEQFMNHLPETLKKELFYLLDEYINGKLSVKEFVNCFGQELMNFADIISKRMAIELKYLMQYIMNQPLPSKELYDPNCPWSQQHVPCRHMDEGKIRKKRDKPWSQQVMESLCDRGYSSEIKGIEACLIGISNTMQMAGGNETQRSMRILYNLVFLIVDEIITAREAENIFEGVLKAVDAELPGKISKLFALLEEKVKSNFVSTYEDYGLAQVEVNKDKPLEGMQPLQSEASSLLYNSLEDIYLAEITLIKIQASMEELAAMQEYYPTSFFRECLQIVFDDEAIKIDCCLRREFFDVRKIVQAGMGTYLKKLLIYVKAWASENMEIVNICMTRRDEELKEQFIEKRKEFVLNWTPVKARQVVRVITLQKVPVETHRELIVELQGLCASTRSDKVEIGIIEEFLNEWLYFLDDASERTMKEVSLQVDLTPYIETYFWLAHYTERMKYSQALATGNLGFMYETHRICHMRCALRAVHHICIKSLEHGNNKGKGFVRLIKLGQKELNKVREIRLLEYAS